MNLVIALLSTRTFITAERIRETVYGYADSASDEAFSRMFERDKNELRDLGIPLETGRVSQFDPTEGYRINRDAYALPAVELTADEAAAVAVATQLWESPELITATQGALLKLRAAGVDVDAADSGIAITSTAALPGLRGSEDVLGILLSAIDSGQAVQFPHRPSRSEPYTTRTVEPWGVVTDRGRWYLVGHDRDRDATRTFRLSRIGADVTPIGPPGAVKRPDGVDLREIVDRVVGEWPAPGPGHGLGRRRPRHRAAPPGHRRRPADAGRPRRRGDHRRHRHVRPAGPRDRQLRRRRRGARAAVAARRRAGPAARAGGDDGVTHDRRLHAAGPAAQHGAVLPGQPEDHLRRGRDRPRRQRQAAARRPQPAVDVRSARLRPRRPDRLRILRRHHRSHVLRGHRPSAAADLAGGHRRAGRAAGPRSTCPAWSTPRPRAARSPRSSPRRARSVTAPKPPSTSPRPWKARRPPRSVPPCATAARWRSSTTRPPTTCCPAASSTRSAWCWSPTTATWRRGAGRPRGCGCSGSTASSTPRCSTSRRLRPPPAVQAGPDTSLFDADPSLPSATLLIDRSASWMFDYYPLRVLRELPDGACEAAMTYASDEWMARFVLGFGSAVRVLEPESLAAAGARVGRGRAARLWGRCGQRRRVDSAQTSGGDQIGWSTTLALVNRHRRVRAALRRQEAAGRGPFAGQVDADLQVRDQGDADRLQAG